ncbi:twin-arginine translocase TatA/TatE family subunit [Deinococcus koreensis]|uniref:Sec-independent protein translocase protein TatA n=2 Tax=Deinococcus koreensis TaxID=2054903 RepID=A0A2K3UZ97_9DEIO|nr:twin-arginine translocase TatA/TatE family subunit [Deinococcus koreensis]
MPNLGPAELIVILIVALVVFGPRKLPELGKSLGAGLREFRKSTQGLREELEGSMKAAPTPPAPAPVQTISAQSVAAQSVSAQGVAAQTIHPAAAPDAPQPVAPVPSQSLIPQAAAPQPAPPRKDEADPGAG